MMFPYPVGGRYAPGVGQSARIGSIRVINHNFLTVNTNSLRYARHVARIIGDTVVPALGDPRRERPPAVYGHFVNVPTHFNFKLPLINGHLPNADTDSHLLVVSTCYNGQCKKMPRFQWSFQPKIAGAHPNLGPTVRTNSRAVVWWPTSNMSRHRD